MAGSHWRLQKTAVEDGTTTIRVNGAEAAIDPAAYMILFDNPAVYHPPAYCPRIPEGVDGKLL